jgi:hypothetical protein
VPTLAFRASLLVASGLSLSVLAGCEGLPHCVAVDPQYVVVERVQSQAAIGARPEITSTPAYAALRSSFRTVALRLPDNCQRVEAELHREGNQATQLESRCGIPLQALETTLTRAGFQVLSWSTLMGIEHQQNVPVHIAAQQLGADFVVIVNDLYAGPSPTGQLAEARYRYSVSDAHGEAIRPAPLYQSDRGMLKEFVRSHAGADVQATGNRPLEARLNASIVLARGADAPTALAVAVAPSAPTRPAPSVQAPAAGLSRSGEAIWFYNWRIDVDPGEGSAWSAGHKDRRYLFAGIPVGQYSSAFPDRAPLDQSDPNRHYWWPVKPDLPETVPAVASDQAIAEDVIPSKVDVSPDEEERLLSLFRRIAEDFVERFKGG